MGNLVLDEPKDVRELIRLWIKETCENGKLPFEGGGTIVQLLNTWLRSYETEKIENIEKRLEKLEGGRGAKRSFKPRWKASDDGDSEHSEEAQTSGR